MILYIFFIYPAIVVILSSLKRRAFEPRWEELPHVTMLLSAHNEETTIASKIENVLQQEYPQDRLDLIIVDDGSTDRTVEVVRGFPSERIDLLVQESRAGKTAALNRAAVKATGDVLVFTDANAIYQPDAVQRLVAGFDKAGKIGVVCGELKYTQHEQAVSDEESRYWGMEIMLKKAESNIGSLLGANGSIYAMRRELYQPLREDLISDFITPLLLTKAGYDTVYQPEAVSTEKSTRSLQSEFRRKKRIVQRGLYGLRVHSELLNPAAAGWLAIQLWSHKVLRWLTPFWLIGILVSSALLYPVGFFKYLYILQILSYLAGFLGILMHASGRAPSLLRIPAYVLMTMGAALSGVTGVIMGKKVVVWNPQR
ncbi:glycosyltransferase family 2 protein [bacterium]|nr:glycosyltransferase family 2 protein [bacterium]